MNRMRGMLEDEMTEKRNEKLKQMQLENKRLALEKKQREAKWRHEQEHMNQKEIADPNYTWGGDAVKHSIQFSYDDENIDWRVRYVLTCCF